MDGTTGRDDGQDIDGGTAKLLMRSRSSDPLVRVRCPGGPADGSVTRHEASHTQSQTSPSRHRTHPPEPEPGPSGPFDVTPRSYDRGRGLSSWEERCGRPFGHRVDRDDVEPDHGLRPHVAGMRQLLRARARQAAQGHGPAKISQRRRPPNERSWLRADRPRGRPGHPLFVAVAAAGVRQLDERPLPSRRAARLHPPGVRG